jgi:Clostridial hydrophobic W
MFQRRCFRLLLLAVAFLGLGSLLPLGAQDVSGFGYDGPAGFRGKSRAVNGGWQAIAAAPLTVIRAGKPDAAAPLDGFSLKDATAQIEYQVLVAGSWQAWTGKGQEAGTVKKPIEGIKIRAGNGSVRYRASSLSAGFSEWVEDGEAAAPADHRPVNSIEVEWRPMATKEASLEYRALFAGHAFTPWLKGGARAELEGEPAGLIGLEIRNGHGIRYEAALDGRWQTTRIDGELAGDSTGKHKITSFRVFGGSSPVRYRMRNEGDTGWTPWFSDGAQCGESGSIRAISAIQIEPDRGGS